MNRLAEQNERKARTHALLFAIGLHLGLGMLLYLDLGASKQPVPEQTVKVNVAKEYSGATAKTVSHP